jgi:hypothetical protein
MQQIEELRAAAAAAADALCVYLPLELCRGLRARWLQEIHWLSVYSDGYLATASLGVLQTLRAAGLGTGTLTLSAPLALSLLEQSCSLVALLAAITGIGNVRELYKTLVL